MSLKGIALYCLRAGGFAAVVCALYAAYCLLRGKKLSAVRIAGIGYVAALLQITVLRGGVNWETLFSVPRDVPQLIPFRTTLLELKGGAWSFIYHTAGNLMWFVPLGFLLGRRSALQTLLAGAMLSLCIEACQYVLATGCADVDDVILNGLGALLGWGLIHLYRRIRA